MPFKKSTKHDAKLRLALIGPAGSGKTYSALAIAGALSDRVAVLDTEHGSASKYADLFHFDVMEPASFNPKVYIDAIAEAEQAGYGVLILDSLSHAWVGKDGALEMVDRAAARMKSQNNYTAWRDVTPLHNQMVDAILGARLHVIATLRSKMEYVQEKDPSGRTIIRKVGMQPVQRDGLEYEFDIVGDLDQDNTLAISKTRCPALVGAVMPKPGAELARALQQWLAGTPERSRTVPEPQRGSGLSGEALPERTTTPLQPAVFAAPAPQVPLLPADAAPVARVQGNGKPVIRNPKELLAYLQAQGGRWNDLSEVQRACESAIVGFKAFPSFGDIKSYAEIAAHLLAQQRPMQANPAAA